MKLLAILTGCYFLLVTVSRVCRYVNPRASTSHAHPQAVEKGEEERRRATSKKTAKAVGGTRTRLLID